MAKKFTGRPRTNPDMTGIRISKTSNDLAREAGTIFGESIVQYVDRIIRDRAKADIVDNARRRLRELGSSESASEGKPGDQ